MDLLLLVKVNNTGGVVVDYTDIVRNYGEKYSVDGRGQSAWGLKIVSGDDKNEIVKQQIGMKFDMHWDSTAAFNSEVERVFAQFKPKFENLKPSYSLESNYPRLKLGDFQLLGGR